MRSSRIILSLLFIATLLTAQNELPKVSILPEGRLFQPLVFDPNEAQAFGSIVSYWEEEEFTDKIYLPFGLGFYKGFLRGNSESPWEIGFDFAAQSQFIWTFDDGKSERNILNIDFKVSVMLHKKIDDQNSFRLRFYHVSSHLGDDFILRNGINNYFPNPNNYEQLDFHWAVQKGSKRYYFGAGMVVRPKTIRERLSFQFGTEVDPPVKGDLPLAFTGGFNIKLLEENNFTPGVKAGIGIKIGRNTKPLRLLVEFYRGNLPYSPFEFTKVQWLGAGIYFMP